MVPAALTGRRGQQAEGTAKPRQVYLGGVFTQHQTDAQGHPVRDGDSTTYVSRFAPIAEFGPCLRQEAIRRGLGAVGQVVLLIDGAAGLENMGRLNFKDSLQIVDFYHAMEHAGQVLEALLGKIQKAAAPLGQAAAPGPGGGLDQRHAPSMRGPAAGTGG